MVVSMVLCPSSSLLIISYRIRLRCMFICADLKLYMEWSKAQRVSTITTTILLITVVCSMLKASSDTQWYTHRYIARINGLYITKKIEYNSLILKLVQCVSKSHRTQKRKCWTEIWKKWRKSKQDSPLEKSKQTLE